MYAKIFKQNYQFPTSNQPQHPQQQSHLIGLLTTIDNLKPEYKVKYEENFVKKIVQPETKSKPFECPLDLSVKITSGDDTIITPPITPHLHQLTSPLKKRYRNDENFIVTTELDDVNEDGQHSKSVTEITPKKPIKPTPPAKTSKPSVKSRTKDVNAKKQHKAVRKLKFDEHKSSPVSGTIIRSLDEIDDTMIEKCGDIDPQYNIVEVTDEAKAELAQITNVIGAYICKLCRIEFDDAFGLARHRCSCIVLLEYRCPECGKRFNCPANLASHRRWHKPRDQIVNKSNDHVTSANGEQFKCKECGKFFKRQAYLRKHQATHRKSEEFSAESNDSNNSSNITNIIDSNSTVNYSTKLIFHIEPNHRTSVSSNSDGDDDDDDIEDSTSESSSNHRNIHPHKKFRLMTDNLTEDENIAATALAYLRNGASVIKHTHALSV